MPPKPKFTKEDIAQTALNIVKENGLDALTARELGKRLGTSASPIFTIFDNMDQVKLAARQIALEEFKEYIRDFREYTPAFKRIGMMIVSYGAHEPELFKLLFMQEHTEKNSFRETLRDLGGVAEVCMELIQRDYGLSPEIAELLFEQMWTHAYGLGTMCAMGVCRLSDEEIGKRLGLVFVSLVQFLKNGDMELIAGNVEKNTDGTFHGHPLDAIVKEDIV